MIILGGKLHVHVRHGFVHGFVHPGKMPSQIFRLYARKHFSRGSVCDVLVQREAGQLPDGRAGLHMQSRHAVS